MAQLIDTSIFIALERRGWRLDALVALASDESVALASITASELLIGVHRADTPTRRQRRQVFVDSVLTMLPVISFDLMIARTHAQTWARLAAMGQMIGAHDLLIAATALTHDYAVLTDNVRDFGRVPGLSVLQPTW